MIYKKIFQKSGLSNQDLCNALGISHNERQQFEKTKKVDFERFVKFGRKLGFNDAQLTEMVVEAIREILTE